MTEHIRHRRRVREPDEQAAAARQTTAIRVAAGSAPSVGSVRTSADLRLKEQALASAKVGVAITDLQGLGLYVNRAFLELWGLDTEAEALGRSVASFWEDPEAVQAIFKDVLAHGRYEGELTGVRRDGSAFPVRVVAAVVVDEAGKGIGTTAFFTDVTEQRRTEAALRAAESRWRSAMASAPVIIITYAADGTITYVNHTGRVGRPSDEVMGSNAYLHLQEVEADALSSALAAVFERRCPVRHEAFYPNIAGGTWFSTTLSPIEAEGRVAGAISISVDITDQKRAEQALRTSEAQLREAQRLARVGYWSLDLRTQEMRWSDLMYDVYGVQPGTPINWDVVAAHTHPDDHRIGVALFEAAARTGESFAHSLRVFPSNGGVCYIEARVSFGCDAEGVVCQAYGIAQDITEREQTQATLRRSRDDLSLANAELARAVRIKDEFMATMSHELRTPLTAILGLAEVLQLESYGPLNENQRKSLQTIEESGQHLLDLITDILDLSKIEAGQLELQTRCCSVGDLCRGSLQMVKGMAQKKGQDVAFTMHPAAIELDADSRRLKQVLVNLLSNAVKFTRPGGELGLAVEGDAKRQVVHFAVWDRGIGIHKEDLPRIFQPFVQLDSSLARQNTGTGLGLPLVQHMVDLHGGSLGVTSTPGQGSRFTVSLPWRPSAVSPGLASPFPALRAAGRAGWAGRADRIILVVDDSEITLRMLADYLGGQGWMTATARRGAEAIERAGELRPALILMDLQMPGMDGLEAIRRIRASERPAIAATPIIAVTALAIPGDAKRCLAEGADAYMSKPPDLLRLARVIAALTTKSGTHERGTEHNTDR
jgi:PAS domain S-box-containing protein